MTWGHLPSSTAAPIRRWRPIRRHCTQRGYVLWVLLICIVLLVGGAWRYSAHKKEAAAAAALAAERAQKQAEKTRLETERAETERRLAADRARLDSYAHALRAFDETVARWEDAVKVANTTGRISLSGPVAKLQDLHRETEKLLAPPCLDVGKASLVKSMSHTVSGFLIFMRNELKLGDTLARADFEEADKVMEVYRDHRRACPAAA